jgi:hypothetical protein
MAEAIINSRDIGAVQMLDAETIVELVQVFLK